MILEIRSTSKAYPILNHRYAWNFQNSRSSKRKPRNTERHSKIQVWGSGVPRASRARGQSQFWRPHPDLPWQLRCEKWVGT